MPITPHDWEVEGSESRFTLHLAIGFGFDEHVVEAGMGRLQPREVIESEIGDWILREQPGIGVPEAASGSWGRGASATIAVLFWLGGAASAGIIGNAAWSAAANLVSRLREQGRDDLYVSRGMAATLAADHVAREFGDAGPFTLEAADEPSSLGGHEATELSYFGAEPWIVLLRGAGDENRYTAVVEPDGRVSGVLRTPIEDWQRSFQRGPIRVERRQPALRGWARFRRT